MKIKIFLDLDKGPLGKHVAYNIPDMARILSQGRFQFPEIRRLKATLKVRLFNLAPDFLLVGL